MKVTILVGCPGAGKDTYVNSLDPLKTIVISKDRFRIAMFGSKRNYWDHVEKANPEVRKIVAEASFAALYAALQDGHYDIVLNNTHLAKHTIQPELDLLRTWEIDVTFRVFHQDLETLLERNRTRLEDDRMPDDDYVRRTHGVYSDPEAWWRTYGYPIEYHQPKE